MKHAQTICVSLGQLDTVVTFDLAIYAKAKQIQMKFLEEFRLGGFHIALNFLSLFQWQEVSQFWIGRPPYRVWGLRSRDNVSADEGEVLQ